MALLKTDWTHELAQVKQSMQEVLDEQVEPLIDKTLDRGVSEMQTALNKLSFEMDEGIARLTREVDHQRRLLVRDVAVLAVAIVLLSGLVGLGLIGAYKAW